MTADRGHAPEFAASLRAAGMRVTGTRERVYAAVAASPHSTPETLIDVVNGTPSGTDRSAVPASSVYRALDALEAAGLVTHTHLDHHAPTYHLADHARHIHMVCRSCGAVAETPVAVADSLVGRLDDEHGFAADVTHMAIHGRCAACRT